MAPAVGLPIVVVLLGLAIWRFASNARDEPVAEPVPIRCQICGHEFVPDPAEASPVCPSCGERADIRLFYFRCKDCGETFVAYEFDPTEGLIREPDGEWMPKEACSLQPVCPNCRSSKTFFVVQPDAPDEEPAEAD